MRTLVSIGIFKEETNLLYGHNLLSRTLIDPTFRTLIIGMFVVKTSNKDQSTHDLLGRRLPV